MASPQAENGHIDIANEIAEQLAKTQLSGYESRVLWVLWRKTYGWHKKDDRISISQFSQATEIARRHIHRTLEYLVSRNIVTKNGNKYITRWAFQKDYSRWKNLITKNGNKLASKTIQVRVTETVTKNGNVPKMVTRFVTKNGAHKRKLTKETSTKTFSLFDFWNSLKIIIHKNIKGKVGNRTFKGCLEQALKDNNEKTIREAMQNYKTILEGEEYFWKYRWTVGEFLIRGLDKFLTINKPFENFRIGKENQETKEQNYDKLTARYSNR